MRNINSYSIGTKPCTKSVQGGQSNEELSAIFDNFINYAQKLEVSYKHLQDSVKEIDQELANTNESLNKKVQELNSLTGYLNNILESMHSGVVAIDTRARVTTFNKAAEKILNVNAKDVIGKDIESVLSHIGEFTDLLIESLSNRNNVVNLEREIRTEKGAFKNLESSISILKDGNGRVTGVVEIFRDLSEIYELKGRLHSANNLVSVGTMAASIAHEIRNPLNGIEGFASLLERDLTGDNLKLAKNIIQGSRNINRIVTDLLLLARPIKLNIGTCKLIKIIDKSLVFVSQELTRKSGKNIQIKRDYSTPNYVILCDPERLQQAFLNIMLNAIQSMHEGGSITVFTRESTLDNKPGIQIGFTDTGEGISNDSIKKIFDPFFTTKDDGTGLGLAMVRKIIELHGGRVGIKSKHKKGTTFSVYLRNNHNGGKTIGYRKNNGS